jgi:hypothetical protein
VIGENKERWKQLCEQAANEQDPPKLVGLVKQINDLLDTKKRRLDLPPTSRKVRSNRQSTTPDDNYRVVGISYRLRISRIPQR